MTYGSRKFATAEAHSILMDITEFADTTEHLTALADLHKLHTALAEYVKWTAEDARRAGASWAAIGWALDISKQAAQVRYGYITPNPKP